MAQLTLVSLFAKNSDLVISAQELKNNYLYGMMMSSSFANKINLTLSDADIEFHIRAVQKEMENYLAVKLHQTIFQETLQFSNKEWRAWGYIKTSYPIVCPLKLEGFLNTTLMAIYPREWLSVKTTSTGESPQRQLYLVPAGNTGAITNAVVFAGILPNLGYMNAGRIPNYWSPTYVTGFPQNKIPYDILQCIGQFAAINILWILGSNIYGFPGISGMSLSIDGLSQSTSSQLNAFGARIKDYHDDLMRKLPNLRDHYRGFNWLSV
jgi:hypothetical protein